MKWGTYVKKVKKPLYVNPFSLSPQHKERKFSAVIGTTSSKSLKNNFPWTCPFIEISKNVLITICELIGGKKFLIKIQKVEIF
jgi:hypothetical protein